ncbi:hypothetical protein BDV09DRAFT_67057 [Aspergillus tetrazonus]
MSSSPTDNVGWCLAISLSFRVRAGRQETEITFSALGKGLHLGACTLRPLGLASPVLDWLVVQSSSPWPGLERPGRALRFALKFALKFRLKIVPFPALPCPVQSPVPATQATQTSPTRPDRPTRSHRRNPGEFCQRNTVDTGSAAAC